MTTDYKILRHDGGELPSSLLSKLTHDFRVGVSASLTSRLADTNATRSGTSVNILHDMIAKMYQDMLEVAGLKDVFAVRSESEGKLRYRLSDGDYKNLDYAIVDIRTNQVVCAGFLKAPISNYNKNSINYKENHLGCYCALHTTDNHMIIQFLDIVPKQDIQFSNQRMMRQVKTRLSNTTTFKDYPMLSYGRAQFSYTPEMLVAADKQAFLNAWMTSNQQLNEEHVEVTALLETMWKTVCDLKGVRARRDMTPVIPLRQKAATMFDHAVNESNEMQMWQWYGVLSGCVGMWDVAAIEEMKLYMHEDSLKTLITLIDAQPISPSLL